MPTRRWWSHRPQLAVQKVGQMAGSAKEADLAKAEAELARLIQDATNDDNVRPSRDKAIARKRREIEAIKTELEPKP